jgi:hypothetical protein
MKLLLTLLATWIFLLIPPIFYAGVTPCIFARYFRHEITLASILSTVLTFWVVRSGEFGVKIKRALISFSLVLLFLIISAIFINSCYFPEALLEPKIKVIKVKGELEIAPAPQAPPLWCF